MNMSKSIMGIEIFFHFKHFCRSQNVYDCASAILELMRSFSVILSHHESEIKLQYSAI